VRQSRLLAGAVGTLLTLVPTASGAQGRAIALPDTNGAAFSIADSAKALGSLRDYDAVVGFWHFRFQYRNADGTYGDPFTGHWSFELKPGGGLVIDTWRPDDPSRPMAASLYTFRLFDPEQKVWRLMGGRSEGGQFAPGKSWTGGGNLYVIQCTETGIVRIRYFDIQADRFLWRADHSTDNGKTWVRDYWMMEATRIGK
jgi:hypothetical protein